MSNECVFCILPDAMTPYRKAFQMFLTASGVQQGIYRDPPDVAFRLSNNSSIAPSTARPEFSESPISSLTHALTTRVSYGSDSAFGSSGASQFLPQFVGWQWLQEMAVA